MSINPANRYGRRESEPADFVNGLLGDRTPNAWYTVTLDGATSTSITGASCTNSVCQANGSGTLSFTYSGSWSTHTFALQEGSEPASLPSSATNPIPATASRSVARTATLSFTAGSGATSHGVYFGTDSAPDETKFKGSQAGTTYDPGTLAKNTTYWWRIDEVNGTGTTTGKVWSFTTVNSSKGGVCQNCGRTSQEGESASPETTTLPESPAPTADESGAATSTRGGSPATTPFRCAKTAPETDGLSPAGLVNLLVSLGIIPVEKAKPACDALSAKTAPTQSAAGVVPFSQTLRRGARGAEVTRLQVFLNTRGFAVAESGPGSRGSETELFGTLTEGAVKRYQAAYAAEILVPVGLTTPSGFWGPSSIKKANRLAL